MSFPSDFFWGAATSAYQIEGAAAEDGKGLSIWDMICRKPGAIKDGRSGESACDHYHRYREDVTLMKEIGIGAYRFSVSWPRVMPHGTGKVNTKGMEFYDRLVDELASAGIAPFVSLFHWDFPYELYCRGGWLNRDSSDWFADYVRVVVEKLSDRIKHWITFNEPQVFIGFGHLEGKHAPGDRLGLAQVLRAGHHALLAHGKAVEVIRSHSRGECQVGFAPVGIVEAPAEEKSADIEVARKETFSINKKDCWNNTWWMDPVFFGRYPEDGLKLFGSDVPEIQSGDMEIICRPLDFFGFNNYRCSKVRSGRNGEPVKEERPPGAGLSTYGWPVTPESLYWGPKFFYERYKLPIVVTENGIANTDWVSLDGKVHDPQRIDFLKRYIRELERAAGDGVDVRGYFCWTLMDNFEWAEGFNQRFGLIYVDYQTQKRIPKDSAYWYKKVIETNGGSLRE